MYVESLYLAPQVFEKTDRRMSQLLPQAVSKTPEASTAEAAGFVAACLPAFLPVFLLLP